MLGMTIKRNAIEEVGQSEIYLTIFGLYTFFSIIEASLLSTPTLMRIIKLIALPILALLLIVEYLIKKQTARNVLTAIVISASFLIAVYATKREYLIVYALFIILAGCIDFKRIVKVSFWSTISALLVLFGALALGIVQDYIYYSGDRVAHCLGFDYYSQLPFILYYLLLKYLLIKGSKIKSVEYLIVLVMSWAMYELSTLRLAFYLSIFTIAMHCVMVKLNLFKINRPIIVCLSSIAYPAGLAATYIAMKMYDPTNAFWVAANRMLSTRLSLMHKAVSLYPVKLFGNYFEVRTNTAIQTTTDYFYIDSGFAYALIAYGLIFAVTIVALYSFMLSRSAMKNDKGMFVWIVSVLLFTMINNTWVSIDLNPILLGVFPLMNEGRELRTDFYNRKNAEPLSLSNYNC